MAPHEMTVTSLPSRITLASPMGTVYSPIGHFFFDGPVDALWFQKKDGVGISDRRDDQPFSIVRRGRDHHLDSGGVGEYGFWAV
jgi:hypothetical protein